MLKLNHVLKSSFALHSRKYHCALHGIDMRNAVYGLQNETFRLQPNCNTSWAPDIHKWGCVWVHLAMFKIEVIVLNCLDGGIEVSISIYMYICIAKCYMFNRMLIVSSRWSDSNYSQLCACAPATENWQQIKCIPYITCIHQEFQQKMMRRTTCSLCVCVCVFWNVPGHHSIFCLRMGGRKGAELRATKFYTTLDVKQKLATMKNVTFLCFMLR